MLSRLWTNLKVLWGRSGLSTSAMVRAEGAGEDVRLVVRLPRTDRELQRHRLIQRLEIVIKHLDKPLNRKHFEKIKTCTCFILNFSIHKIVFLRIQFCEI